MLFRSILSFVVIIALLQSIIGNPFERLDKSVVLQEARSVFNATPISPRKCQLILTKLLFIISKGEHLGPNEATDTFFAMTKLFQNKDVSYYP